MNTQPAILNTVPEMRVWRRSTVGHASEGTSVRVGFVPTMGALHAGHAQLLKRMRENCDRLVLSIFVNPTQFGPKEDLSKYPRTFESDLALARECGVDAIFFPTPEQMYPSGYSTYVEENSLTGRLCGEFRPGHFRGVTTVVLKLFNIVQPELAYFGLKDAQQFFVLSKMARDLDLPVSVEGIPTVRESDGLAMSSRNVYLSPEHRAVAPTLYQALMHSVGLLNSGASLRLAIDEARLHLNARRFKVQYLEVLQLPDLTPLESKAILSKERPYLLAVAAHLGGTRLIDNVIVRPELLAQHGIRIHR